MLRDRKKELFAPGELAKISPKFQKIIDNLELLEASPGSALVYSNFKTLEGVSVFGLALEAQKDYVKFDLMPNGSGGWKIHDDTLAAGTGKRRYMMYTGDEDRNKRRTLLAIFNGQWNKIPSALAAQVKALAGPDHNDNLRGKIARVFMITQSGAEGISLANVRQVHIMESYWNYVRLEQVKGRAIRICSHMKLPVADRNVKIFTYISKFNPKQTIDETLKNFDQSKTTDEYMYDLMERKKQLADSIIGVMKEAAVDCDLNHLENGVLSCFTFEGYGTDGPLFHPLLAEDLKRPVTVRGTASAAVKPATVVKATAATAKVAVAAKKVTTAAPPPATKTAKPKAAVKAKEVIEHVAADPLVLQAPVVAASKPAARSRKAKTVTIVEPPTGEGEAVAVAATVAAVVPTARKTVRAKRNAKTAATATAL